MTGKEKKYYMLTPSNIMIEAYNEKEMRYIVNKLLSGTHIDFVKPNKKINEEKI